MSFGFGMGFTRNDPFAGGPSLNLQFAGNTVLDPSITFTRALNTATYFNSAGVLTTANANVPRFDYDPSTLAPRGLLIEEARTNSIRNNTMQGAVAGTPGTLPTNWTGGTTVDGLAREIVGAGVQNGITYVDIRYSGTSGALGNSTLVTQESNTQISAANAQTWTASAYVSLVGGSLANVTSLNIAIRYNDAAGASLTNQNVAITPTASATRVTNTFTAANASTAFVNMSFVANFADNSAVDITLRIGLPQLEQGAFATSVIPTTTTALTRNADVAIITGANFSNWFNASAGSFVTDVADSLGAVPRSMSVYGASGNEQLAIGFDITRVRSGGVDIGSFYSSQSITGKRAVAYATNEQAAAKDGAALSSTNTGLPSGLASLWIGQTNTGAAILNGHLRRITYYPRRLSNAELQSITS